MSLGRVSPRTVYSVDKGYELVVWVDGTIEERTYIGPSVVVLTSRASVSSPVVCSARYQLVDRLGSFQASTDETLAAGLIGLDAHDFDAWGKPRAWDQSSTSGALHVAYAKGVSSDRGFTGHEHLDSHQLIHMNGRMYDPGLGRFLSVDPIISNPANPQSINPYSYIGNNPLSGTDPTGYESVGTGCGAFSKCDVTFVNPSPSSLKLYAPGNASNEVQRSNGSPGLQAKQDCKDSATCGAPKETVEEKKPRTLAQRGPVRRGGGARVRGLPPEDIGARLRLEQQEQQDRILERIQPGSSARIEPQGRIPTQAELNARWKFIRKLEASRVDGGELPRAPITEAPGVRPPAPGFVVTPGGDAIVIPRGATGPDPTRAPGAQYTGGTGGPGLDPKVTGVRIMEGTPHHPQRAVYTNESGQTVDPATGSDRAQL